MSINLLLIQHVNRAKTLCNRIIKVCLMFAAGSLKQMDSLLELFVVFDSEDVHVYTVYFTNARVYKGSTALNGQIYHKLVGDESRYYSNINMNPSHAALTTAVISL